MLENGDFEEPPSGGFGGAEEEMAVASSIPGWTTNGTVELVRSGQKQGGMILIVPQGSHAVRLGNEAEIGQELMKLEKGSTYAVTFSAARTCAQLESLNVSFHESSSLSSSATVDLQTLYSVEGWDAYAWAFQAMGVRGDTGRIAFRNPGMEEDPTCGPIVDNIAIKKLFNPDSSSKKSKNVVINGDFEEGPWIFPNESLGVLLPTNLDQDITSLPGWIVESNRAVRFVDSLHFTVPQGKRAVELLSGKEGIISQMVKTTQGKQYNLTFNLGTAGDKCRGGQPLAVMAFAGDQAKNTHYAPTGNMTHQSSNLTFTAKAERTRVAFYSVYYNTRTDDKSSLCGPVVDDVRVMSVSAGVFLNQITRDHHWLMMLLALMFLTSFRI